MRKAMISVGLISTFSTLYGAEFCPTQTTNDPVICLAWDRTEAPEEGTNFEIVTTGTGSLEFPNVKLLTGDQTWRVWSVDSGNTNNVGDIGEISSPAPANFSVRITVM